MQKLIIKTPFMGVQPCEIEFDRFLLLIGEQASGKSTIAKLIYFFQGLPDAIYRNMIAEDAEKIISWSAPYIYNNLQSDFTELFNHSSYDVEVAYYYDTKFSFQYEINKSGTRSIGSNGFYVDDSYEEDVLLEIFKKYLDTNSKQQLLTDINQLFNRKTTDQNYLIAGRNNIVAFPQYFESKAEAYNQKTEQDEVKQQNIQKKIHGGNEKLLLEFVNWAYVIRKYFQYNGGTFKGVKSGLENKEALNLFEKIFAKILKAEYRHDSNGEFLKLKDKQKVFMRDASSGQQEALRVLQGLFWSVGLKNRREFFVIEEPETHLYPLAQKELINAFALFLNTIQEGRLIITTHSPYILACVNILLFAHYVAKEAPKHKNSILKSVQKDFWLDGGMFNAYSLGQEGAYCKSIKDPETGLIEQTYLDTISEQLGLEYHHLYNILVKNNA